MKPPSPAAGWIFVLYGQLYGSTTLKLEPAAQPAAYILQLASAKRLQEEALNELCTVLESIRMGRSFLKQPPEACPSLARKLALSTSLSLSLSFSVFGSVSMQSMHFSPERLRKILNLLGAMGPKRRTSNSICLAFSSVCPGESACHDTIMIPFQSGLGLWALQKLIFMGFMVLKKDLGPQN